jgi:hypothetical protein
LSYYDSDADTGAFVYRTTDYGRTFERLGAAYIAERLFDEHMVLELADGRLAMFVRTRYGIGVSYSEKSKHRLTVLDILKIPSICMRVSSNGMIFPRIAFPLVDDIREIASDILFIFLRIRPKAPAMRFNLHIQEDINSRLILKERPMTDTWRIRAR